jgi:glutamate synthase domain-containing protein 2
LLWVAYKPCNAIRIAAPTDITTHDKKRQRSLVPSNKAERIAHYHQGINDGVGIIAHSCGVSNPRQLRRRHARIVTDNGMLIPLDQMYPEPIKIIDNISNFKNWG